MLNHLPIYPVGRIFAGAAPGTTNYIFSGSTTPAFTPHEGVITAHVTVDLATSGIFNLILKNGSTTVTSKLNGGTALAAGTLYTFTFEVRKDETYDFKLSTDSVINVCYVSEIGGGNG